jgi:uncharacterized tellurite resistance protein B-like protein
MEEDSMSVFDKLMGKRGNQEESDARGYVEAMIMMIAADGVIEEEEIDDFMRNVYQSRRLAAVPHAEMMSMIKRSLHAISTEGVDRRIAAVGQMLPSVDQKLEAVRMCVSICASDGDVAPDELEILKKMQREFDLSDQQIETVLQEV